MGSVPQRNRHLYSATRTTPLVQTDIAKPSIGEFSEHAQRERTVFWIRPSYCRFFAIELIKK